MFASPTQRCSNNLRVGDVCRIDVLSLRPTQSAVGFAEVQEKVKKMRSKGISEDTLLDNTVPVTLGPLGIYLSDEHHFLTALYRMKHKECIIKVLHDYRTEKNFWAKMSKENLVWAYDERGMPIADFEKLPKSVAQLKDDPLRSLVHFLQKEDEIEKVKGKNFYEFRWANLLREYIGPKLVEFDFDLAMKVAKKVLNTRDAEGLPGFRRPARPLAN